jgi:putative membrane protein
MRMELLTTWTFAPLTTSVALVAGAAYLLGTLRLRRNGRSWPWWRTGIFVGLALPLVVLTVSWWPGARAHALFAAYMTQVVVLALVAPALLVLGAPIRLGRDALAGSLAGRRWDAVFDSRVLRVSTHPLVTPLFMLALPVLVVFTPLLLMSLQRPAVYAVVQLALVILGTAAVLGLVDRQVPDHGVPYAFAAFVAFFELLLDAIPGGVLFFTTSLLAGGWYAGHGDPRGADWALSDQQAAGAILWAVGEGIDVPFLLIIVILWMRADAEEARRTDAILDAQDAERRRQAQSDDLPERPLLD